MKVSIIIPIYNVEPYIESCLRSVANQSLTEGVECILVDDCGSDNSLQIAEDYIRKDTGNIKFSIIHREKNGGLSAARNTGIDAATGEYLYFLDSDDEITADCMELLWGLVEKYGKVDLVQGSFYRTEEEKATLREYGISEYAADQETIKSFLLEYDGYIVASANKLIKKVFLQKYNLYFIEGIIHEDNYWSFFLAKYVNTMCLNSKRTYYHRCNHSSITRNRNKIKESIAYKTIIHDLCQNLDTFLKGKQKTYILNNLLTAFNNDYLNRVEEKKVLKDFNRTNNLIERFILFFYLKIGNTFIKKKALHLLIRIYNI